MVFVLAVQIQVQLPTVTHYLLPTLLERDLYVLARIRVHVDLERNLPAVSFYCCNMLDTNAYWSHLD